MKRRREIIMEHQEKKSEIKSAIEELSVLVVKLENKKKSPPSHAISIATAAAAAAADADADADHDDHQQDELVVTYIPTRPFLALCSLMLQVLDKIGPTMAVLRQDIFKNIQRLEVLYESDPVSYSNLVAIINKEAVERNAKTGDSCSKAFVWLTRSLDFTAALLQGLAMDPRASMEQIVRDSYEVTLKPWHGWISAAAYKVALKLVPETTTFISLLMAKGDQNLDTLKEDIQVLISLLFPLLDDIHSLLRSNGLEKLKST